MVRVVVFINQLEHLNETLGDHLRGKNAEGTDPIPFLVSGLFIPCAFLDYISSSQYWSIVAALQGKN
jgi:hypothetical protein